MNDTTDFDLKNLGEIVDEYSPDDLTLLSEDGRLVFETRAVTELLGYKKDELKNENAMAYLHPSDLPQVMQLMSESKSNPGKRYRFQYRFKNKMGDYAPMDAVGVYVEKTFFQGYLLSVRKLSNTEEISQKLIDAEERYRNLLEKMPDAYVLCEMIFDEQRNPINYVFLEFNSSFLTILGLEKGQVVGKKVTEVIHGIENDSFDWIGKYGQLVKDGKGVVEFDRNVPALNRFYKGRAFVIGGDRFVTIFNDVTDIKQHEAELEKLQLAVENVSSHVVLTDVEGIVFYANSSAEKITGFTKKEIIGTKAGKLWSLPMSKEFYRKLWNTIKIEKKSFEGNITNKRKGGEEYYAKVTISPIINKEGELVGFIGIEDDITEQQKSKEELEKRYDELERLNSLMVGRELKMAELKKENLKLQQQLEKR